MATFGKTTIGGSTSPGYSPVAAYCIYNLSEAGDVSKVTFYTGGTCNMKMAIYDVSGGVPNNLLATSNPVAIGSSFAWVDFPLTISLAAGDYALCWLFDATNYFKYDAGSTNQHGYKAATYPTFPNPYGTPAANQAWAVSIYATYTPSVGGQPYISRVQQIAGMQTYNPIH